MHGEMKGKSPGAADNRDFTALILAAHTLIWFAPGGVSYCIIAGAYLSLDGPLVEFPVGE